MGDLKMVYQPIVDLSTNGHFIFESLLRIPTVLDIQAAILAAEGDGSVIKLDEFALRSAHEVLRQRPHITLTVNISIVSIEQHGNRLGDLLWQGRDVNARLIVELTETQPIKQLQRIKWFVKLVRQYGGQVALDDFGNDFADRERARQLRPDFLKISWLPENTTVTKNTPDVMFDAKKLMREIGCPLIMERIESQQQATFFRECGVSFGQGYFFGRPTDLQ
ncbi:EAL domain-containing protein [Herbaspirillum huttiense]|uniref:EAL domain-containing protein n=1 Tax=Herbaspirillum huttiense TaxID=863372 RepID=UPI00381D3C73